MPTVLIVQGYRFFFWSNENDEPVHVHVEKGDSEGKIWIEPEIGIAYMHGFSGKQESLILEIVEKNVLVIKQRWNEHFSK